MGISITVATHSVNVASILVLHETDRFLFNNNSESLIDNSGNQILKGGPIVPGEMHDHSMHAV